MIFFFSILLTVFYCHDSLSAPVPGVQKALMYLSNYGYLESNSMGESSVTNAKTVKKSIMEFQDFIGIPITGRLDRRTMKMMSMPRCGIKDKIGRSKRYAVQGSKWKTKYLKYRIMKYPSNLDVKHVDDMVKGAFELWAKNSDLIFKHSKNYSEMVNIDIKFVRDKHGDDSPFDGSGGVLAHAFFPEMGGAIHFDDAEPWTKESMEGVNLLQVANHEIGHSLGLSHSDETDAAMSPLYNEYVPGFMLHDDDIMAIQKLYGKKMNTKPKLPLDPTEEEWTSWWNNFLEDY